MLPHNAFLRRIPNAIELQQRLVYDAIVFASDSIEWAYDTLGKSALAIVNFQMGTDDFRRAQSSLFGAAWTIIDNCHALRSILRQMPPKQGGPTEKFLRDYEATTCIRNAADHLANMLPNLAKKKKFIAPIFGVLSLCISTEDDLERRSDGTVILRKCRGVTVTAGTLVHPKHQFELLNPSGREIEFPAGPFEFQAYDYKVCLSDLVRDVSKVVTRLNSVVETAATAQVPGPAKEAGLDPEKVMSEHGGSLMIVTNILFPANQDDNTSS